MDAARAADIGQSAKHANSFARSAGTGVVVRNRFKCADVEVGFLAGFASRYVFGHFTFLDDAGDHLEKPGSVARGERPDAELFDEHDGITHWVVWQNSDRMTSLEHFACKRPAPCPTEEPVAEQVAIDPEIAAKDRLSRHDGDIIAAETMHRVTRPERHRAPPRRAQAVDRS